MVSDNNKSLNIGTFWLGWLDSNQRMAEPKPAALPLGDTPTMKTNILPFL